MKGDISANVKDGAALDCGNAASMVPRNTKVTCTYEHTVTQEDIDAGSYSLTIDYQNTRQFLGKDLTSGVQTAGFTTEAKAEPNMELSNTLASGGLFTGPGVSVTFQVGMAETAAADTVVQHASTVFARCESVQVG